MSLVKKSSHILPIALLFLLVFLALYIFRFVDDNRLVSWRAVDDAVQPLKVFGAVLLCLPVSYFLSRFSLPGPVPLLFISYAIGVLFWREPEVIIDASRYFTQAKHLEVYGVGYFLREWGRGIEAWTDMPLVPFLYGMAFKLIGESRLVIQTMTTAMFSLTVSLVALMGRELWDERTGNAAGALLLAMPYLYTQVPLMLVDVPSMFFLTLSVFMFFRALRHGGAWHMLGAAFSIFLAVFSKYSLWPMLSVLGVVFILRFREEPASALRRTGAVAALAAGLLGLVAFYYLDVIAGQVKLLYEYQRPGLGRWSESFASTFLYHVHPFVTFGALFSVWVAVKRRNPWYLAAAWPVLLLVGMQVRRIRYLLPVFPMLALISAYGLGVLMTGRARRFAIITAASVSVAIGVFAYVPFLETNSLVNLRDAGRFLDTLKDSEMEVQTMPQKSAVNPAVAVPILDFYTKKKLFYLYEPGARPPLEVLKRSSFRFTWRYRNPRYYTPLEGGSLTEKTLPIVIISSNGGMPTEAYGLINKFNKSEGLYRFRPFAEVYRKRY